MTFGHRNDVASAELGEMDGFGRVGGCAHHPCHLSHPVLPSDVTQLPTDVHIYSPLFTLFTPYPPLFTPSGVRVGREGTRRVQGGCKAGILLAPSLHRPTARVRARAILTYYSYSASPRLLGFASGLGFASVTRLRLVGGARRVQGGCKEGARRVQGGCKTYLLW